MTSAPFLAPIGSRAGGLLQVKPYPDYASPVTLFDISPEVAAIAALQTALVYPSSYTFSPSALRTIVGGFGAAAFNATVWFSTYWLMSGLNTECDIQLPLQVGSYVLKMLWTKGSSTGDLSLKVDGVNLGTAIGYNATNLNAESTWAFSVAVAGLKTLNFKVNAKQAASSAYNITVSQFVLQKT